MNEREKTTREPRWTKGPWEIAPHPDDAELLEIVSEYSELPGGGKMAHWISECDASVDGEEDREAAIEQNTANAHLIAAAPDLYAVLRDLEWVGMNDGRGVTHQQCPACSARKARGSGHNPFCGLAAALAKAEGEARHGG